MRETEALVKKAVRARRRRSRTRPNDVHTRAAEDKLRFALGTRVRIVRKGKGGRIEIDFVNEDELAPVVRTVDVEAISRSVKKLTDYCACAG